MCAQSRLLANLEREFDEIKLNKYKLREYNIAPSTAHGMLMLLWPWNTVAMMCMASMAAGGWQKVSLL